MEGAPGAAQERCDSPEPDRLPSTGGKAAGVCPRVGRPRRSPLGAVLGPAPTPAPRLWAPTCSSCPFTPTLTSSAPTPGAVMLLAPIFPGLWPLLSGLKFQLNPVSAVLWDRTVKGSDLRPWSRGHQRWAVLWQGSGGSGGARPSPRPAPVQGDRTQCPAAPLGLTALGADGRAGLLGARGRPSRARPDGLCVQPEPRVLKKEGGGR